MSETAAQQENRLNDKASERTGIIETDLPGRLDRLPWGRFHTLIVLALGITWLLDGLEVTLAGAVASALKTSPALQFSNADVGIAGSAYVEPAGGDSRSSCAAIAVGVHVPAQGMS